jgi:hypothetical protein
VPRDEATTMTRKDYIKAAEIIKNKRLASRDSNRIIGDHQRLYEENVATEMEETFIQFFQSDNPKFNKGRFSAACDLNE